MPKKKGYSKQRQAAIKKVTGLLGSSEGLLNLETPNLGAKAKVRKKKKPVK